MNKTVNPEMIGLGRESRGLTQGQLAKLLGVSQGKISRFEAGMLAVFAQWERRLIGQRTKDALAVKRAQGTRLGRPRSIAPELACEIVDMHHSGSTYSAIARELNRRGVPTAHAGREWHDTTIRALVINSRRE